MSMKTIFVSGAVTTLAIGILFGGVFAWKTSASARGAAVVGTNVFEIKFSPKCDATLATPYDLADEVTAEISPVPIPCHTIIGYDGVTRLVGKGTGVNRGDFRLAVVGGDLKVRSVRHGPPGDDSCKVTDFEGAVRLLQPGIIIPPGGEGGDFNAYIKVVPGAPAACQGDLVYYRVTIEAENPLPTPAEAAGEQ